MNSKNAPIIELKPYLDGKSPFDNPPLLITQARPCSCSGAYIDPKTRELTCRKCGERLDPVEFILQIAHRDRHLLYAWDRARKDLAALTEKVESLKREEENLRARIRRASR